MVESSQQFTGEDENWRGELVIPQEGGVYPSKLGGGCHIIDVDYFVKVVAQVQSCCKADLEVFSSIIIGTCRTAAGIRKVPFSPITSLEFARAKIIMSVEAFEVIPDKLEYWPGETVRGKVVLKVKSGFQTQGIFLNLKGGATANIVEQIVRRSTRKSIGGRSHSTSRVYTNRFDNSESFLSMNSFVAGDGRTLLNLRDGETSYPFSFQLPSRLVSSYYRCNGEIPLGWNFIQGTGQVSYYLELGMIVAGKAEHVSQKVIGVHTNLDLNIVPDATQPGEAEVTKIFCNSCACCCCQSGPLVLKVRTDKRGYLPGESIAFDFEANNKSNKTIKQVSAQLVEAVTLNGQGRTERVSIPVGGLLVSDHQFVGEVDNWRGELIVPKEGEVYPTKLGGGCSIIEVDYFLEIKVQVQGCCNGDSEVLSSIIIGTCRGAARVPSTKSKSLFEF
ncbi:Arrestin domain-containing protein 3 [Orchesella cincta]|uniref:Arrestin domain-containing protein 3 n=1 Tax=Orchesella cincta TaxID=48709 RepID=A0A1D2MF35_ORCCI|nr:Arrestin domain-containing protein 3 [Orchesella cincta]